MQQHPSSLAIPGQLKVGITQIPAPCADPIRLDLPNPGVGLDVRVYGGFSKLEKAVLALAPAYRDVSEMDLVQRAERLLAAVAAHEQGTANGEASENASTVAGGGCSDDSGGETAAAAGVSAGGIVLP